MIYLAPNLPSDSVLSMKLYLDDLITGFRSIGFDDYKIVVPEEATSPNRLRVQWDRYIRYPSLITHRVGINDHLHVIDHSYGHLCAVHKSASVTCHDIAEFRLSDLRSHQLLMWKKRVRGMRKASSITAISQNTKNDILELLDIPERKVSLNHYGHDPRFSPADADPAAVWERYGLLDEFTRGASMILHVGSNIYRKNIPTLLSAISILKARGMDVVLVKVGHPLKSSEFSDTIDSTGITDYVKDLGPLPIDALIDIYRCANVFAFPSTYEGFGRPILEAQGCGCPVVLSSSSCLQEVGGDAALYHEPLDADQLGDHLLDILTNQELSNKLRKEGLQNVTKFSWGNHARLLLESVDYPYSGKSSHV